MAQIKPTEYHTTPQRPTLLHSVPHYSTASHTTPQRHALLHSVTHYLTASDTTPQRPSNCPAASHTTHIAPHRHPIYT